MQRQARILLIDDDEVDFVITRKLLGKLPEGRYELDWVDTYDAALRAVASDRYDVCLVDYQLGSQTGLDLLREVRARGSELPMIILTARGDERIDAEAFALGAAGFIDKARLDSEELDRSLRYALRREGLVNDLIKHNAELLHLHHLTELFLSDLSLHEAGLSAAGELARFTHFPMVAIERYDRPSGTLEPLGVHGGREGKVPASVVECDRALAGRVVESRAPAILMQCSTADREAVEHLGWTWIQSCIALPMTFEDELVGVLTLAHSDLVVLDSSVVNQAATVADHLARLVGRLHGTGGRLAASGVVAEREMRLAEELAALEGWARREAAERGLELSWQATARPNVDWDAPGLRHALGSMLESALAGARAGPIHVFLVADSTMPTSERLEVSFELPSDPAARSEALAAGHALAPECSAHVESRANTAERLVLSARPPRGG